MKKTRDGFTFIELLVVLAIIAIIAVMLLPVLGSMQCRRQRVLDMVHLMASNGTSRNEPLALTNGWYYIDANQTNANDILGSFICQTAKGTGVHVDVCSGVYGDYGNFSDSGLIKKVASTLSITNGYFIVVWKNP